MAAVVVIICGHGLRTEVHQSKPYKRRISLLSLYFHFNILFKQLYTSCKIESFKFKGESDVHKHTCIEVFKRRADLGYI